MKFTIIFNPMLPEVHIADDFGSLLALIAVRVFFSLILTGKLTFITVGVYSKHGFSVSRN